MLRQSNAYAVLQHRAGVSERDRAEKNHKQSLNNIEINNVLAAVYTPIVCCIAEFLLLLNVLMT